MTIVLRQFHADDGPALLAIHTRAILATSERYYTAEQRQSWAHGLQPEGYAKARDSGEVITVATLPDQTVVGFVGYRAQRIVGLYVDPDHQGRGIGRLLLHHGEDSLHAAGVSISCIHSSLPAVGFYQAQGYVLTRQGTHISRGGLEMADAHLEKPLAAE